MKFADKICPAVLHNLDNADPVVIPALWECALHTLKTIEVFASCYLMFHCYLLMISYLGLLAESQYS
jgi:RsiW-degrading membrane proteinase PrsW (M82 family)